MKRERQYRLVLNDEERRDLAELAARRGVSMADIIRLHIRQEIRHERAEDIAARN
jgi:hypothetical protein